MAFAAVDSACARQNGLLRLRAYQDGENLWHSTLDLRALPPDSRPAALNAVVDATQAARNGEAPRISIAVNGVVVARAWGHEDGPTNITADLERRFVSTRNRIELKVGAGDAACAGQDCPIAQARLVAGPTVSLRPAVHDPQSFAEFVTRFRGGMQVSAATGRDRAFAALALRAIAPLAPQAATAGAEIVVSRQAPPGTRPPIGFDGGSVEIVDRDGVTLYDARALDRLTIVQMLKRGRTPVLWVRPGPEADLPPGMELDHGSVALFSGSGLEIAFSPDPGGAVKIVSREERQRAARFEFYWQWSVAAVWLVLTAGFVIVFRRLPVPRASGG